MTKWQSFLEERREHRELKRLLQEDDRYLF